MIRACWSSELRSCIVFGLQLPEATNARNFWVRLESLTYSNNCLDSYWMVRTHENHEIAIRFISAALHDSLYSAGSLPFAIGSEH